MLHQLDIRTFSRVGAWLLAGAAFVLSLGAASAQSGDPIKIGYGISQTGGLAPDGKSAEQSLLPATANDPPYEHRRRPR
jgi:hypothetical protein